MDGDVCVVAGVRVLVVVAEPASDAGFYPGFYSSRIPDLQSKLLATGAFSAADVFKASSTAPTLSALRPMPRCLRGVMLLASRQA